MHLLGGLVRLGESIFPPTIHPMVVHFPIALLYVTLLFELLAYTPIGRDHFAARVSFWTLTLSLFAIVAAGAAGVISEHFVHWTPQTAAILSAHQHDAVLTGVFALGAWVFRVMAVYPSTSRARSRWSLLNTGRGRQTPLTTLLVVGAVVMVSITGSLGGSMVYGHGVGIHPPTKPVTTQRSGAPSTSTQSGG